MFYRQYSQLQLLINTILPIFTFLFHYRLLRIHEVVCFHSLVNISESVAKKNDVNRMLIPLKVISSSYKSLGTSFVVYLYFAILIHKTLQA